MLSIDDFDISFRYRKAPSPLPAEYRPLWRTSTILLMLKINGRGGKLSFKQLQVIDWAIRSPLNTEKLLQFLVRSSSPDPTSIIGIDPSLNKAVNYANGSGFIEVVTVDGGARVKITDKGLNYIAKIINAGALVEESKILEMIGKKLNMSLIDSFIG